jgi:hypothetical protein
MRRFLSSIAITALSVFGAICFAPAHAYGGEDDAIVSTHFISDSFEGTSISSNVWGFVGTNQPNNITLSQNDGFYVSISSTTTNDFTSGLTTRCKLHGDFDAVLSFRLAVWPPKNGVWVNLAAADTGGYNVYRVSWQFDTGEDYGTYLPQAANTGGIVSATGNEGVLRLSRQAGIWTGYFLSGSNWVAIASGVGPTIDTALTVGVFNLSGVLPFGGAPTEVVFKGFHAIAAGVVCPN